MPLYRYKCENEHTNLQHKSIDNRDEPIDCRECGKVAKRNMMEELQTQSGHVFEPYFDENLATDENPGGTYVKSRRQKKKLKKRLGLREKESFVE